MLKDRILGGMVLLVLILTPTVAMAGRMHGGRDMDLGKWWLNPQVSDQLKLSDAEKAKLDEAFRDSRRKLIDLKSAVERQQFELENLLEKEALDEDAVARQFGKLEEARSNLAKERFNFLIQVRKILGHERFQRIKGLRGELRAHRRGRNTEGPGPEGRP